jgi:hypothetical protein
MGTVPLRSVEEQSGLGGPLLVTAETIDLLVELLTEAERRLAKIAAAVRDDRGRAA